VTNVTVDVKEMLAAGVHFGHRASRRHPKMAEFIHSKRGEAHIIDLIKTAEALEVALGAVEETVAAGKTVLFVGTKRQARDAVKTAADAAAMPYVTQRWLGGMLTNNRTMSSRIKHLLDLEKRMETGELAERYSKLEVLRFQEEIERLNAHFDGMKNFPLIPGLVFVTDVTVDHTAVKEARKLGLPVVGICDTNANPTTVTYPVPANDDAIKSIELISSYIVAAIKEGRAQHAAKAKKVVPEKEEK
jgi:small subunit ribosomal protein S2